jgi:hypothetical protein
MRPTLSAFAAIVAFTVVTPLAPGALAAGAAVDHDRINSSNCVSVVENTICFTNKGELHAVETRSGNVIVQQNVTITTTQTNPVSRDVIHFHDQAVVRPGADQEAHSNFREVLTVGDQTCTYTDYFHVANGKVQFDRDEVSCR